MVVPFVLEMLPPRAVRCTITLALAGTLITASLGMPAVLTVHDAQYGLLTTRRVVLSWPSIPAGENVTPSYDGPGAPQELGFAAHHAVYSGVWVARIDDSITGRYHPGARPVIVSEGAPSATLSEANFSADVTAWLYEGCVPASAVAFRSEDMLGESHADKAAIAAIAVARESLSIGGKVVFADPFGWGEGCGAWSRFRGDRPSAGRCFRWGL